MPDSANIKKSFKQVVNKKGQATISNGNTTQRCIA
jgi:hypothetical protein